MPLMKSIIVEVLMTIVIHLTNANRLSNSDVSVLNITRLENGDIFYITGGECGVTRCTEVSGGTALSDRPPGAAPPCSCRCPRNLPLFREDILHCVSDITECPLVQFGTGDAASRVPFVFIPLSGQIVHPSKEINFEDSENAVCAVSGAQFLTRTGWSSLKNEADNDVPFGLYRDEGKTFLQWRGSEGTRTRATGRAILAKLSCRIGSRIITPCVGFRVPGSPPDLNHDMSEVWFSHGELSAEKHEENGEISVMGGAAGVSIVFCSILALLLYGSLLVFHFRNKHKRPSIVDVENPSFKDDSMPNTKTNPLVSIESFLKETQGASFDGLNTKSDSISTSSNTSDIQSSENSLDTKESEIKCLRKYHPVKVLRTDTVMVTNATIHTQKSENVNVRDERSFTTCSQMCGEKIPEQHVAIVEAPEGMGNCISRSEFSGNESNPAVIGSQRKKLYFNPSYFEIQYLKSPPPAAIEFLTKIREVISIAKEKMLVKRFIPLLTSIPEEESFQSIDFELSFPYETLSRYHTAHSLKRESSRRKNDCSGCPGCTDMKFKKKYLKTLSEKEFCKTCVTNEFKQDIVRKWLDEVPVTPEGDADTLKQYRKSIAKVQGTPTSIKPNTIVKKEESIKEVVKNPKQSQDKILIKVSSQPTGRRKKMPPPPPPPPPHKKLECSEPTTPEAKKKEDDARAIPPELKQKMNAVINELSKFRKIDAIQPRSPSPVTEVVTPFIPNSVIAVTPRLVIPTPPKYAKKIKPKIMSSREDQHRINNKPKREFEIDSLERSTAKRRASISNVDSNWLQSLSNDRSCKRRSSIIAMEELEPMKKIYEMNSRLSRSFQELSATSSAWKDELFSLQDDDAYKNHPTSLVSEVYIDDYVNTTISASESEQSNSSSTLKVKYKEPITRPGQLVIEVEGPAKKVKVPDYEDFDPDTLDRKPGRLKLHKEVCISPPISPNKNIDMLFRSSESEDSSKDSLPKLKIGSLLEIFEAKNKNKNSLEKNIQRGSDVSNVVVQNSSEEYRPPLPPKKRNGKIISDASWENQSTFRITDRVKKSPEKEIKPPNSGINFRITRSEPYMKKEPISNRIHHPTEANEKKRFTTFGTMNVDHSNNNNNAFHSLEATYENSYDEVEPDQKYFKKSNDIHDDESYEKIIVKSQSNLKRSGRRSSRQRYKRIEQNKMSKTEDSGYLSSDSNESRHKGKFILQVRDKDDTLKEMVSDTDDLDSVEDARSESGGESVETNSVFFGSFRRLSLAKGNIDIDLDQKGIDSGFHGDFCKTDDERSLKKSKSSSVYRDKFSVVNVS